MGFYSKKIKGTLLIYITVICNYIFLFSGLSLAEFSFAVISDQRHFTGTGIYDNEAYFRGAIEALKKIGAGAFLISPGDIDPPQYSKRTIEQVLGTSYQWFPVVGNHELPNHGYEDYVGENMEWLRQYHYDSNGPGIEPDIINYGPSGCPETTYSFDFENVHFIVLNVYCDSLGDDGTDGNIPDHLYNWLDNDLASTTQTHIFVIGHEPAYPQPDADNGRMRHMVDSLNLHTSNRDRFWNLLNNYNVVAYFCGHTHNYSASKINGLWQVDAGHGRGAGDLGAPSTFIKVLVSGGRIKLYTYRDVHDDDYDFDDIVHAEILRDWVTPAMSGTRLLLLEN